MRKKLGILLSALLLMMMAVACSTTEKATGETNAQKITIEHKLGKTDVPLNPKKVVVLDFGTLDSLDKLGVEVVGVPQNSLPSYLSKYKDSKYTNVGTLKELDFEKINELEPDVILISGRQEEAYAELSKIAPTVFTGVDTAKYMDSFKANARTLGKIFGKEAAVEAELTKIDQTIQTTKEKAAASQKNGLVVLANEGKVSAYGPNSRFGIIHDVFGVTPVDPNIQVSTHGQNVSNEYILEKNPDYLFVVDRGAVVGGTSSAKAAIENEIVKKTKAYTNQNIVYLDPNYWYLSGGGLISVSEMVKQIEAAIK
ncbi:siderophore ABC transporter substrate-binding protein [Risungbinella massiliensis]|uniref:siderophore ABC transporter substrate-binding protein n=1 Tax=Risungbinella massiliensis TaxID=1329796 RepID=UPI0005CC6A2C|nr:siderophore ABC transporter substrate-binding protein [Risungbinella massiliensis]